MNFTNKMPAPKILIMFPSLEGKGGVVSFCQLLIQNLAFSFTADYLMIGNRPGNRSLSKRLSYFIHDSLSLRRKLNKNRYDLIHLNPSFKILSLLRDSFYLSVINKFHSGKTVVMFHGWNEDLASKVISNFLYRKCFQRIYKKSSLILVLCNLFKEQLIKMGILAEKVRVITTMYEGSAVKPESQEKKDENTIRILFMARFVKSKGVYIALEVGRLLIENGYKDFELTLAGEGPESEGLQKYIAQHGLDQYIHIAGFVTGEKKWTILKSNDIFLYPSYYGEGCPIVVLEAMSSGLAIISTPLAAIPEIVKDNENGFLVSGKNPQAFYEAVKRLIENRELLKKMQNLNKKKADEFYEAKVVTRKIEALYLSVIDDKEQSSGDPAKE